MDSIDFPEELNHCASFLFITFETSLFLVGKQTILSEWCVHAFVTDKWPTLFGNWSWAKNEPPLDLLFFRIEFRDLPITFRSR